MSEPRTSEITVETPTTQEWNEEMVAQWNALAETVTRTVQQSRKHEGETGQRERAANEQELKRMRAALAASEQRMANATQESAEKLQAMRRHYDLKVASLERDLERTKHPAQRGDASLDAASGRAVTSSGTDEVMDYEEGEWEDPEEVAEEEPSSWTERLGAALALRWSELRAGSLFLPIAGILAVLLVVVLVYPLLRHTPVRAANSSLEGKGTENADRPSGTLTAGEAALNASAVPEAPSKPSAAFDPDSGAKSAAASPDAVNETPSSEYAVLLAGGKTLTATRPGESSAEYEARLAVHAGYTRTAVYQKNGRYIAVVLFGSQEQARDGMKAINDPYSGRWKKTSSVVSIEQWCPDKKALAPVVINGADVAVWACGKGPS